MITNPQWVRKPTGDDVTKFYPPLALRLGIEGHTSMQCTVKDDGTLELCHIISETPAGKGFGEAELRLASRFHMRPRTVAGQSVTGAKVVIPVRWSIALPPPPATPPGPTPH